MDHPKRLDYIFEYVSELKREGTIDMLMRYPPSVRNNMLLTIMSSDVKQALEGMGDS